MKNSFFKTMSLLLLAVLLLFIYLYKPDNSCADCRYITEEPNNTDDNISSDLVYTCSTEAMYRNIHIDLKHGFGLFGEVVVTSSINAIDVTKVDAMNIKLKEYKTCTRFNLRNAKYLGKSKFKGSDVIFHHFQVDIGNDSSDDVSRDLVSVDLVDRFNIKPGEYIDIHITSSNPDISKTTVDKDEEGYIIKTEYGSTLRTSYDLRANAIKNDENKVDYGERFCRSLITIEG
ncbi:hypothetical protein [Winogradskyella sp.]|uniref:hypothetical protein n=1 Tax=Winogradskyella sp. TaxID=1883156 RepID=UPI0026009690|nr:hypothetical protein [Winogradskyella sp.]